MKIKEHIMITLGALAFIMITGVAKSEETITPQEFATKIAEVPAKIGSHISNEIVEIKDYQAKSWADAKKQWQSLINKFVKTESTQ
jgi:hypothetical protein